MFNTSPNYNDSLSAWNKYNEEVLATRVPRDEDFELNDYKVDHISQDLTDNLLNSLRLLPRRKYHKNDCTENYVSGNVKDSEEHALQKIGLYFNFEEEQLSIAKEIGESIRPTVESCLGTGFRIINTKCFETFANAKMVGPTKMHWDGLPKYIHKALIYLTEASMETGTTFLRLKGTKKDDAFVIGPPGTYAFLNPNTIHHKGVPGTKSNKIILEFTMCPAYETEINPTFNGTSSRNPIYP